MNAKAITPIVTLLGVVAISGGILFAAAKPEQEAQRAAEQWLALLDAGQFAESWKNAAASLQKMAPPEQQFVEMLNVVRKPFGNFISRKLKSAQSTNSIPGAPGGEYVIFQFDSAFKNHPEVVETVSAIHEKGGAWKAAGYSLQWGNDAAQIPAQVNAVGTYFGYHQPGEFIRLELDRDGTGYFTTAFTHSTSKKKPDVYRVLNWKPASGLVVHFRGFSLWNLDINVARSDTNSEPVKFYNAKIWGGQGTNSANASAIESELFHGGSDSPEKADWWKRGGVALCNEREWKVKAELAEKSIERHRKKGAGAEGPGQADAVGNWIGYDHQGQFCRLELYRDGTGYFCTTFEDPRSNGKPEVYRVSNWKSPGYLPAGDVSFSNIEIAVAPVDANADPIKFSKKVEFYGKPKSQSVTGSWIECDFFHGAADSPENAKWRRRVRFYNEREWKADADLAEKAIERVRNDRK